MTIVLGRRGESLFDRIDHQNSGNEPANAEDFERAWIDRRNRMRETTSRHDDSTWPREWVGEAASPRTVSPVQPGPGVVGLYADRVRRGPGLPVATHRVSPKERAVVGGRLDPTQRRRSIAVLRQTEAIGRGSDAHYAALYPERRPTYRRMRVGGALPARPVVNWRRLAIVPRWSGAPGWAGLRGLLDPLPGAFWAEQGSAPRRVIVASIAVLILIASAATSGLASQGRYEVRAGDTIESIAAVFEVDPNAIRAASYLPTGDALEAGQVLVIPEPGQSPDEAAQMAAAREGTSPWVTTAHVVSDGETIAGIAAAYGVSADAIIELNGVADPSNVLPGTRLMIPAGGDAGVIVASDSSGPTVSVPNVPTYTQSRNLSCEYAAAFIATSAFGAGVSEETFLASVPLASNPHYGYRGNIDGWWGNTTDYGIYPEPLVPVLNEWGFAAEVMYTGGDVEPLIAQIDAGHPVLVWLGFWGDTREVLDDEDTYSVFAGMHVVTVYGYSDAGVWVSDPAAGSTRSYGWDEFVGMWSVVDGMSLAVYPY